MSFHLNANVVERGPHDSLLSPADYDGDAASIRSDQDSDDDEGQLRARNSRELRAHDRLVLTEEEETDQLVTELRRQQDPSHRGSGLMPNPLRLFSGRHNEDSPSNTRSPVGANTTESREGAADEKRSIRRARRKARKDRLLSEAQHGEDGELFYEMEEGGMKEGSSTGNSSDRDNSDDVDRRGLLHLTDTKKKRGRTWWRWLLLHATISVVLAILVLVAWKLSKGRRKTSSRVEYASNGTHWFAPTTIIVSLDGFRADFLQRGLTPRLNAFIREGVSPLYMLPSFPSVTFPNHFTLATGLYPESHGVVGNSFWDPTLREEFLYTDPSRSMDPKWWNGEPFWVTAEEQGVKTAIHMWPGSEAHVLGVEPSYLDKYNGKDELPKKVERIFHFLDMPVAERPQIIAAYVPNVDTDGHKFGPNSTEIRATIQSADHFMDQVFQGLDQRNLTDMVNVIVVSDHGMATTDISRLIQLEDLVDLDKIEHTDGWPLVGLRPKKSEDVQNIYHDVVEKAKQFPSVDVYRDVDMPERYHFSKNDRIAPLWIIPKTGWALVKMSEMNLKEAKASGAVYHPRGLHGYDHEHPLMRAIFIARGPAFPHEPNSRVEVFQNIEVYNMLCDSVGIDAKPNNGTLRLPLKPIGLHDVTNSGLETPPDPPESIGSSTSIPASAPINDSQSMTSLDSNKPTELGQPDAPATTSPSSDGTQGSETLGRIGSTMQELLGWAMGTLQDWWGTISDSFNKSD